MGRKTKYQFVKEANIVHNNKYGYEKFIYINNKTKGVITCDKHGNFEVFPNNHLKGNGCRQCSFEKQTKNIETFIKESNNKHNNLYSYRNFIYTTARKYGLITCKIHGDFKQTPTKHLQGDGCPDCGGKKLKTLDQFINEATLKHNKLYSYHNFIYINDKTKGLVTCKIHGDFYQEPSSHLQGVGCPNCKKESHWRRSEYNKKANGRVCTFYILKCYNEKEEFYKIGITMNTIQKRYSGKIDLPYEYKIIKEIKGNANDIWDMELAEKRRLKEYKYLPIIKFGGSITECFTKIN